MRSTVIFFAATGDQTGGPLGRQTKSFPDLYPAIGTKYRFNTVSCRVSAHSRCSSEVQSVRYHHVVTLCCFSQVDPCFPSRGATHMYHLGLQPEARYPTGQPWGKSNLCPSGKSSRQKSGNAAHTANPRTLSPARSQWAPGHDQRPGPLSGKPAPRRGSDRHATAQVIKPLPLAEGRLVACCCRGREQLRPSRSPLLRLL